MTVLHFQLFKFDHFLILMFIVDKCNVFQFWTFVGQNKMIKCEYGESYQYFGANFKTQ